MESSSTDVRQSDDRLVLLKKQQEQYFEGSFEWADIQAKINQIIAEKFLQYVNR